MTNRAVESTSFVEMQLEELERQGAYLEETIKIIDENLESPNLLTEDEETLRRSRELFEEDRLQIALVAANRALLLANSAA